MEALEFKGDNAFKKRRCNATTFKKSFKKIFIDSELNFATCPNCHEIIIPTRDVRKDFSICKVTTCSRCKTKFEVEIEKRRRNIKGSGRKIKASLAHNFYCINN